MPDSIANLVRRFESGELDPATFRHGDHVRLAWGLLQHHDFFEAHSRLRAGLKSLAARAGRPGAYHETITLAFLAVIYERVQQDKDLGWDAFSRRHADLLDKAVLGRFYSPPRLSSREAREGLLLPDRSGAGS